jgi:protein ImuB
MLPIERVRREMEKHGCTGSDDLPLVLAKKTENALRVFAADGKAARLGLYPGLPLSDARARVPALHIVEADENADAKLLESIADWCDRFTPLVALDFPHGIFLDISGCAHLFQGEHAMAEKVAGDLRAFGFTVRHAIASTAAAARALTRSAPGVIVPAGSEAEAVSMLPVSVLREIGVVTPLKRAGLKTIGEVAARSPQELRARFGAAFIFMLDQILGRADAPISPRRPVPDFTAEQHFPEPVATSDVIERTLFALASIMHRKLEERGKGARSFEAAFFRSDGAVRRIEVQTCAPLKHEKTITKLFRERLNALADPLDPGFGFDLIRLSASCVENFVHEATTFEADTQEAQEISALIDRLSARYGAARVLRFQARDSHIPECVARPVTAQQKIKNSNWQEIRARGEPPRRPLRMLAHPEPIHVIAEVSEGPPARFVWRRAAHAIVRAEGPERIAMEWWHENPSDRTRDYFRVEDEAGRRFWLYREGLYGRETAQPSWFMHGLFA